MAPANCSVSSAAVDVSVAALLLLECGLGLLANGVALWTFCFRLQVWRPHAVYLLHLALADLLLTACLPFRAAFLLRRRAWGLGHASCRALRFLHALGRAVTVAFLTAVALDRYLRVVHPRLRVNLLSSRGTQGVSGLVWLLMAALSLQSLYPWGAACPGAAAEGGAPWQDALAFLQFLLPCGLVLVSNAGLMRALQRRLRQPGPQPRLRRARRLVAAVVVLFVLCFLPGFLARSLAAALRDVDSCAARRVVARAADVASGLAGLQSVLHPALYCFSSPTFRLSYRRLFLTLRGRGLDARAPACDRRDSSS